MLGFRWVFPIGTLPVDARDRAVVLPNDIEGITERDLLVRC